MINTFDLMETDGNGKDQAAIISNSIYDYNNRKQERKTSYSSTDERFHLINIPLAVDYGIEKKSQTAISIIRTFYTKKIKESLEWLSKNHETPMDSAPYIQPLFENLKKYKDDHFQDPYSSFISALYDALVFNDSWMKLEKQQFGQILTILIQLNNNRKLNYDTIDKTINKLEKLGLDTTPF